MNHIPDLLGLVSATTTDFLTSLDGVETAADLALAFSFSFCSQ